MLNSKEDDSSFIELNGPLFICNYELDVHLRAIIIGNDYVKLSSKQWDVLLYLIKNEDFLVYRDELIKKFWGGNRLKGGKGVTHIVHHLRKIFKQFDIDVVIATVSKQGYVLQKKAVNVSC